jgi:type VI secretion system secreted protein VgrG
MVPWLWFLTRTSDCRIFQNKTVPDIIEKIFSDLKFKDYQLRLYGNFAPRDYCVQYRETDFNFVSRLMEEEGIYYFFKHEQNKHTLVLANDPAAHEACPGQNTARYDFRGGAVAYEDVITEWHHEEEFRTGAWAQTDYNFETPSTSLAVTVNGNNPYEIYEYPGEYRVRGDGDRLARVRLQEQTARTSVSQGASGCRHFTSGFQFTLQDHYRKDLNTPYLLTAVRHAATQGSYEAGGTSEELSYRNSFECMPFSIPYRPQRVTPQPFVQGCQTAVVVGPGGEEIYTDKYGRVKVQFHWDREGKKNENSSCWIRVSHPWAGQGWGAISIPRIGQEVIVDFLEGDPDQPIITGRVYNAAQMPPYDLPANRTQSGTKSRSSLGGGPANFNEIRLEDKMGSEQLFIHAEKNQDIEVEKDETHWVGHDRKKTIDNDETTHVKHDRTETVDHNETIKIGNIQDLTVKVNRIIDVGKDHTEAIHGSMSLSVDRTKSETVLINSAETIGGGKELSIGGLYQVTVGGAHNTTVGGAKTEEIGAFRGEAVGGKKTVAIGGNHSMTIGGNDGLSVAKDRSVNVVGKFDETVKKGYTLKAKTITLQAEDEIIISVGKAKIAMKKDGSVLVEGKDLSFKASGKINQKASGDIVLKGSKIEEN